MKPLLILLVLAFATAASAQLMHGVTDPPATGSGGGTITPPTCSKSLAFNAACNSQYVPIVH